MTNDIKAPIQYPPLDLKRCAKEPLWCKKEITKRLILLLLEWTRSRALPFITHIEAGGGGPPRPPVIPPISEIIYPVYSTTGDGFIRRHLEATWAGARDAPTGSGSLNGSQYYYPAASAYIWVGLYYVYRSWFDFDLSAIPPGSSISSAVLTLTRYNPLSTEVSIQQGTQTLPLDNSDFQAFTGLFFAKASTSPSQINFTFNSLGIAYLESVLGSTAYLCAREYQHDYLNVIPTDNNYQTGFYYRESTTQANRPLLTITTS